jgi:hypothetical protein
MTGNTLIMVFMTICQAKIARNVSVKLLFMISDSRHDHPNKKTMSGSALLLRTIATCLNDSGYG